MALALSCALVPVAAFADAGGEAAGEAPGEVAGAADGLADGSMDGAAAGTPDADAAEGVAGGGEAASGVPTLAAALAGGPTAFISADVALDGEPVVGSFTVDGLTFAVVDGSSVELVGVSEAAGADASPLMLPESVSYGDIDYVVASISAYAFYLSGVTSVELPVSVVDVDERAFRSSDVASVAVAEGNPAYASRDGVLYDAALTRLLLIPEGRSEGVRIPYTAEEVAAAAFSHASSVAAISVDADSPTYSSEDGLLYNADGTVLLRVPAGATDITIREGCTTIAAGAMEGCASLATINAPASVTSISPDVFTSVPTVSLPAVSVAGDGVEGEEGAEGEAGASPRRVVASSQGLEAPLALPDLGSAPASPSTEASSSVGAQLTALVALSSTDDDLPEVDTSTIEVSLPEEVNGNPWSAAGFEVVASAALSSAATAYANIGSIYLSCTDGTVSQVTRYLVGENSGKNHDDSKIAAIGSGGVSGIGSSWLLSNWGTSGSAGNDARGAYQEASSNTYHLFFDATEGKVPVWIRSMKGLTHSTTVMGMTSYYAWNETLYLTLSLIPPTMNLSFMPEGGVWADGTTVAKSSTYTRAGASIVLLGEAPSRVGYAFLGWSAGGDCYASGASMPVAELVSDEKGLITSLQAQWEPIDYSLGFDTSSEPGDEDYPGIEKPDETANVESGPTVIEDPKRPGYVFQGWVIPSEDGTTAIDQGLVYQDESDGKWYVDTSKLPDYANDEGRVELTARWTSVISVDVPSAVTFYADVVTQGNESREGAASSAFGQNKVASQSQVDLRIVGLESSAVETQGSTLGADSILKKAASATPSSSTQKLFSLYPTGKALTPDDLQDPDAVSTTKPADAVDFALDDILLEKSFAADKFTIPAGDTLNLGYRLNLSETGTELDYDTLSTLEEGQSASIANISYCFAAESLPGPIPSGNKTDSLWIENTDPNLAPVGIYGLDDIKTAANDLSAHCDDLSQSEYYNFYMGLLARQVMEDGEPGEGPYFKLKVEGAVDGYLDLKLIGIAQDYKANDLGKAGLTFQTKDIYAYDNVASVAAGGGVFETTMNTTATEVGAKGWVAMSLRAELNGSFSNLLDGALLDALVPVRKNQQLHGGTNTDSSYLQSSTETIFLPSMYEVIGTVQSECNESEQYEKNGYIPFQYLAYQNSTRGITNAKILMTYNGAAVDWWVRSASRYNVSRFGAINNLGRGGVDSPTKSHGVAPAFCL